ncbi:MAG TPA: crosslink repair DNA glycosylase YcaQ family protein, partial [Candidatus Polarisedimenticolia bacterium]|nr:crosslink repair DNA glycosylase YcaQ family protein [Candidatus Polarisedimenticolia bacterium]
ARRYFRWIGPATPAEFQGFSALGVKATKAALEPLGLVALEPGGERLIFPDDRDALLGFKPPKEPRYSLVSSLDAIVLHRRDHKSLLDEKDIARKMMGDKVMATLNSLSDLPSHAILDRGRLVGLWEYDTNTQSIVWVSFGAKNAQMTASVRETEQYIREDLGDARSFSLDSPKSRAPRIEALRTSR